MVTAWDGAELVGFGYAHALRGDTRWWEGIPTLVAGEIAREWDGRTFAVIVMAVTAVVRKAIARLAERMRDAFWPAGDQPAPPGAPWAAGQHADSRRTGGRG